MACPEPESLEARIARVTAETVAVVDWDPAWPGRFEAERDHLRACLPPELLGRIEHFGSTAIPGCPAKPVVDLLIEVTSLPAVRERVVPVLTGQGYEYFWRPDLGDQPPWYCWFIKRDAAGARTHHLHMVEAGFPHWERLRFRDHLRAHPEATAEYGALKRRLAAEHRSDRVAYTRAKSAFIARVMALAGAGPAP